jgi:photosystem II stability/assembly factor-like uncharacterized protein
MNRSMLAFVAVGLLSHRADCQIRIRPTAPATRDSGEVGVSRAAKWFFEQRVGKYGGYPKGGVRELRDKLRALQTPASAASPELMSSRVGERIAVQLATRRTPIMSRGSFGQLAVSTPAPTGTWQSQGPAGTRAPSGYATDVWAGRLNAIALHPTDPNRFWVGASGGGVWFTSDGGVTWSAQSDFAPTTAISSLAVSPSNPNVIYAGTGDDMGTMSVGLLRSDDAGASWSVLDVASWPIRVVTSVAVHPFSPDTVLVGLTIRGVFRGVRNSAGLWQWSEVKQLLLDGSTTFLSRLSNYTLLFDPVNPKIAYAAVGYGSATGPQQREGIFKSVDGGRTWTLLSGLPWPKSRIYLAISKSMPARLVALFVGAYGEIESAYRTDDAGLSWNVIAKPTPCSPICHYAGAIAISPTDPDHIAVGGLRVQHSENGGSTWSAGGGAGHIDHHSITYSHDGMRLYVAGDGGLWSTPQAGTNPVFAWSSSNAGLAVTQFYPGLAVSPSDGQVVLAGSQDTFGQLRYGFAATWELLGTRISPSPACGDAARGAIVPATPNLMYSQCLSLGTSSTNGSIYRSTDGGTSWSGYYNGSGNLAIAVMPLSLAESEPTVLFTGSKTVVRVSPPLSASISPALGGGDYFTALASAPSDVNLLYAGTHDGKIYRTSKANHVGLSVWAQPYSFIGPRIGVLRVHQSLPNIVYAGVRGAVYRSFDSGATWQGLIGWTGVVYDLAVFGS